MSRIRMTLTALLLVATTSAVTAHFVRQDDAPAWMKYNAPGPQHELLDRLNGRWNQTINIWPAPGEQVETSEGTVDYSWILGGRYLKGTYECYVGGERLEGFELLGHDNFRKEFFSIWIDNMSTSHLRSIGRFDDTAKALMLEGTQDDAATGARDQPFRMVHRFVDDDHMELEIHRPAPDGTLFRADPHRVGADRLTKIIAADRIPVLMLLTDRYPGPLKEREPMLQRQSALVAAAAALVIVSTTSAGVTSTVVGFDGGSDGDFTGNAFFEAAGGNPGGNAHFFVQAFGMELRTGGLGEPANDAFLGDYSPFPGINLAFDIRVDSITDFIGNEIPREIGIALIDRDIQGPSGASGVFFSLGVISSEDTGDWTNLSVTIDDPTQTELPAGVIGFGDEDPDTFEPILPDGATFASVLAGVDEFQITTFVPGFFFANANYDVRIDNVSITVPAPGCAVLMLGVFARRRRRVS